jgi:hypothetical protein
MKNFIFASYDGSQQGVTVRNMALNQTSFFNTGFDINDIAAGPNDDVFLAAKNRIYRYKTDGTLINTFIWPNPSINYSSIAVHGDRIYATYDGSQQGFTVRDLNLVQLSFHNTGFDTNGIAAGMNDDLYLASENNLHHYKTDGTLINTFTWPSTSINYTSITVHCDRVYAGYNGSQLGFTVRDLNLVQLSAHGIGVDINSIAAGMNNDVYIASTNHLFHYKADGTLVTNMTFPIPSINYNGISAFFISLT